MLAHPSTEYRVVMSLTEHGKPGCNQCAAGSALDFDFTMAFQPIVDLAHGEVFAQEALVRGLEGQGAGEILGRVNDVNRYGFDQACRVRAIQLAAELGVKSLLSINFLPNAVYRPESCIRLTIEAAEKASFPIDHIVFEFTEGEKLDDPAHVREIVDYYKRRGFKTAIDDFGAGYAGLGLLADFKTDLVKLDMGLIRNIESDWGRRTIVKGILQVCRDLGIVPIAEGVETRAELEVLQDFGVELFQGYYFAAPAFRSLATIPPERLPRP
jgi:EAL domain-containing protein (putative c-di-GMP-specific phosphodiesterase class I)